MSMAGNCRSKQTKSKINRFMAGNCRSKTEKKEYNSLPRSRLGRGHPILSAVIHSFPINLVQLSVDRLNSFPGCLSVGENPGNEVAFIDVDGLLKLQRFFSSWIHSILLQCPSSLKQMNFEMECFSSFKVTINTEVIIFNNNETHSIIRTKRKIIFFSIELACGMEMCLACVLAYGI